MGMTASRFDPTFSKIQLGRCPLSSYASQHRDSLRLYCSPRRQGVLQQRTWWLTSVVLDWYTKEIVGCYAGRPCTSRHWFAALEMAVNPQWLNCEYRYHLSHGTPFMAA
jgi:hypothetical protein